MGIRQGKTVITVADVPGFYVNRCLGPYIAEIAALIQEGADPLALNKGLTSFGFPVGCVTLADEARAARAAPRRARARGTACHVDAGGHRRGAPRGR